jgi:hypothetical protein
MSRLFETEATGRSGGPGAAGTFTIVHNARVFETQEAGRVTTYMLDGSPTIIRRATRGGTLELIANALWDGRALLITTSAPTGEITRRFFLNGDRLVCEAPTGAWTYRRVKSLSTSARPPSSAR